MHLAERWIAENQMGVHIIHQFEPCQHGWETQQQRSSSIILITSSQSHLPLFSPPKWVWLLVARDVIVHNLNALESLYQNNHGHIYTTCHMQINNGGHLLAVPHTSVNASHAYDALWSR